MPDEHTENDSRGILHPEGMRAVRELTVGLVHELNNILGVIIGNAHLAQKDLSDAQGIEKYIREIRAAADEGRLLMQELAVLAGVGSRWGRVLSIDEIITQVVSTLDAPVALDLDPNAPSVELHPSLAHDAFVDTVCFMAEAKDVTQLSLGTRVLGGEVQITFEDDGPRPSDQVVAAMFTPFAKLDGRPKVGMRLVKLADLASRSGGRVEASARDPRGLRVTLTLPVVASADGPGVALSE